MYPLDDTIAAVASPPGGAARGIVRISGPQSLSRLARLFQPDDGQPLSPRRFPCAVAGRLRLPGLHSPLPCDVYLWARGYAGQPAAEIHTVGSPPLLQFVLRSLCVAGTRLAGPGEFTLRAFLSGRIDLTQAEAVLGVIEAADERDLNTALNQLAGGLARPLHRLRDALLDLLAHVEAGFDFADEELPFITRAELDRRLAEAQDDVAAILRQMTSRGEPIDAIRAVLVGRPNTGKSSLFNALAGDRAALVSDRPSTTRDYLVAELDLGGVKCRLIDTAGAPLAASHTNGVDHVDRAAQSAAAEQRRAAQVEVFCLDSTRPMDYWEHGAVGENVGKQRIVVLTKCDAPRGTDCPCAAVETSSLTGQGIETLRNQLRRQTLATAGTSGGVVAATAARSAESLRLAGRCLRRARRATTAGQEELAAAEMRLALEALGEVVGAVYTEDVLDRIFSRFCIGK